MVFVHQEDDYVIEKRAKLKAQKYALVGIWKSHGYVW